MKQTITNDITLELTLIRAAAATGMGDLRTLDEAELGWIGGGDPQPSYDGPAPGP
jgi:hypothetical protein